MAIYAIGDLHLSFGVDKPMDVFGEIWKDHPNKLIYGFQEIQENDWVILAGDTSWAMTLEQAAPDFAFVDALPGKKLLIKGNHDYWWETATKTKRCFAEHGIHSIDILHNNAFLYEDTAVCGTRGWFLDQEDQSGKVYRRELCRLESSLKAGQALGARRTVCALHYPPLYLGYECREITDMLADYRVDCCLFGHLHGASHKLAVTGLHKGVEYRLVSADAIGFVPQLV